MSEPASQPTDREIGGMTAIEWMMVAAGLADDLAGAVALLRTSDVAAEEIAALRTRFVATAKNATFEGHPMAREKRIIDGTIALIDMAFA